MDDLSEEEVQRQTKKRQDAMIQRASLTPEQRRLNSERRKLQGAQREVDLAEQAQGLGEQMRFYSAVQQQTDMQNRPSPWFTTDTKIVNTNAKGDKQASEQESNRETEHNLMLLEGSEKI